MSWWRAAWSWVTKRETLSVVDAARAYAAAVGSESSSGTNGERERPVAIGGAGTLIAAGVLQDLEHNTELRGTRWYGEMGQPGIAMKMDTDPHVRAGRSYIENPIAAGVPFFRPRNPDRPEDVEAARFQEMCWFERLSWGSIVNLACLAHRDGFAFAELTDEARPIDRSRFPLHPGGGFGIVPTGLHHRPANTVQWWHAKSNVAELASIDQWLPGMSPTTVNIPADRLVRWTVGQEGANFAGRATYRHVYGAWKLKLAFVRILAMKLERQGLGVPHIELPEDADKTDIEAAKLILSAMRAHEKGYLITPFGYKFQWQQADRGGDELLSAISICNRDIAYGFHAGHMMLGLETGSGAHALAQTQVGSYEVAVDRWAEWVLASLSRGVDGWSPVERLHRLNYGDRAGCPVIGVRNLPTRDWLKLAPVIWNGVICGAITADDALEDGLREAFRVAPRDARTARRYVGPAAKLTDGGSPPSNGGSEPAPPPPKAEIEEEMRRAA